MVIKKIRLSNIINFLLLVCIFLISIFLSPYYTEGDQVHYRAVYEKLQGENFIEIYSFYSLALNSKELIHFLLSWIFSNLHIDKDLFVAISNTILAYYTIALLRKWKVSVVIIASLLLINFYFYVLYFSAERLKFGFLFLIMMFYYHRYFYILALFSIFSHLQILILQGAMLFNLFIIQLKKLLSTGRIKIFVFIIAFFLLLFILAISKHLFLKFMAYYVERSILDLAKIFIFFILSLWYSKNKKETIFIFLPLFVSVLLVGEERVNMMAYFVFLYYALPIRGGLNIGILATSVYFLFASVGFISNILETGNGFHGN